MAPSAASKEVSFDLSPNRVFAPWQSGGEGPPGLRWLALISEADRRIMLVLQSYDAKPSEARLIFDVRRLGFAPSGTITDVETGQGLGQAGATVVIPMNRPYATRVVICAAGP